MICKTIIEGNPQSHWQYLSHILHHRKPAAIGIALSQLIPIKHVHPLTLEIVPVQDVLGATYPPVLRGVEEGAQ